jgi:hypothetical protein
VVEMAASVTVGSTKLSLRHPIFFFHSFKMFLMQYCVSASKEQWLRLAC